MLKREFKLDTKNIFNLKLENVFGIEYDGARVKLAKEKGINSFQLDLNKDKIPFKDNEFDFFLKHQVSLLTILSILHFLELLNVF